jgi:hypothetical protein
MSSVEYWVQQVLYAGVPFEQVPPDLRAEVERALGRNAPGVPVARQAQSGASAGREPFWQTTLGLVVALLLPFALLALLIWWLARLPQRAGGAGFVEGFGKLKGSTGGLPRPNAG